MTLGWRIGKANGASRFLPRRAAAAASSSEMRIYPARGIASVVMVNATEFELNPVPELHGPDVAGTIGIPGAGRRANA